MVNQISIRPIRIANHNQTLIRPLKGSNLNHNQTVVIHPVSALLAMAAAARATYRALAARRPAPERLAWDELTDLLGLPEALAQEGKYA